MDIESFKDLVVWQKSIQLVKKVYKATEQMPQHELYGLVSQMRRAAVAIPSNIAEGKKRGTRKNFTHFLIIANGSAAELETQVVISKELFPNIEFSEIEPLLEEIQKMLNVMIIKLKEEPKS